MDLAAQLAAGDLSGIERIFAAHGAGRPHVGWAPRLEDLQPPQLRFLLAHWTALKGRQPCPKVRQIDPFQLRPVLGFVALVDVIDRGTDFRYRLYGSKIASASGFDLTGRFVSQRPGGSYLVGFALAACQAVLQRREALAVVHDLAPAESATTWHKLLLPFEGESGTIDRFLVAMVPTTRSGRLIDY